MGSHRDGSPTQTVSSSTALHVPLAQIPLTVSNQEVASCSSSFHAHRLLGVERSLPGFDLPFALLFTRCSLLRVLCACRLAGYVFIANFGTLAFGGANSAASMVPLGLFLH